MKRLKIEEFTTTITGGTPSTKVSSYWDNGEIPWLNSGALNQGIITQCSKFITPLGLKKSSAKLMPPDTVLIALTGATTGTVGYLTFEACGNQSVTGILPSDLHKPKYLFYFLKSIRSKVDKDATGTAQPGINQRYVRNLEVPLPSIQEQKEIVEILDQAFKSIEKAKANIEKNIENAKELFQSKLIQIFSQTGEGWEEKTFEDVSSRIGDGLHGTPKYNPDGEYYFINGSNLENGKIVFKKNTKRVDKSEFIKHKRNLTENTVLVSINGTLGKVAFYNNEKIVLGKSACYINFNNQINKKFIKYLIKSPIFFKNMTKESTGATIKNFSLKSMRNYKFNLPPKIQQKELVETLDVVDNHIQSILISYEEELKNLEELKKSILQKAFSGELTNKNKAA